jgi:CBS domain containing-hemolysin-like protein
MTVFVLSVSVVLVVSALCSLSEAALYSVRTPYVRRLAEAGGSVGKVLSKFKRNMEYPISAILILNTAANTAGAAVAGAQARILFGETAVAWFSAGFTLAVLFFSEIIPKVLGVVYSRRIAKAMALPLNGLVALLSPFLFLIRRMTRWLRPKGRILAAPEEEVRHMVMMSAEEGSILPFEAELVKNVLELNDVSARDIMTPRPVVLKLASSLTVRDAAARISEWTYSRIPIYSADDPESWTGVVLSRDILSRLARDEFDATLEALKKPLYFVSEKTPGHVLLRNFLGKRSHLFGVVDEYGGLVGVVSLEDVLESVIGQEIVDEVDSAVDLQEVARLRRRQQLEGEKSDRADSQDA